MGGSSTTKVPAWKLRQQQRQNGKLPSALNNDELGGTRSDASRRSGNDELGNTNISSGTIPAWKLRERHKTVRDNNFDDSSSIGSSASTRSTGSLYSRSSVSSNASSHPSRGIRPVSRVPGAPSLAVSRVPGAPDPSLPPAFRAAFGKQQQRKKSGDDFLSLSSVHSRSQNGCSVANSFGSDSFGSLDIDDDDDDDSFDGEDSFASLDSDADEDDDAYRESRNQMARLEIEKQKQSQDTKRGGKSRFKKKTIGVHGTPLDFIAE